MVRKEAIIIKAETTKAMEAMISEGDILVDSWINISIARSGHGFKP